MEIKNFLEIYFYDHHWGNTRHEFASISYTEGKFLFTKAKHGMDLLDGISHEYISYEDIIPICLEYLKLFKTAQEENEIKDTDLDIEKNHYSISINYKHKSALFSLYIPIWDHSSAVSGICKDLKEKLLCEELKIYFGDTVTTI